jgi:hypothetical protein
MALNKNAGANKKTTVALTVGVACAAAVIMLMAARKPAQPAGAKPGTVRASMATTPAAAKTTAVKKAPEKAMVVDTAVSKPDVAEASAVKAPMAAVTLNGCLERDGDTFRLKDTDGADAPKSRSWKSGFIKKGSAKIDVIDSANRLKLKDHVGQRVSVTGMLDDKEMQARSLMRIASTCEQPKS